MVPIFSFTPGEKQPGKLKSTQQTLNTKGPVPFPQTPHERSTRNPLTGGAAASVLQSMVRTLRGNVY